MEELIYMLIGGYMLYSIGHLAFLQKTAWCMRTTYEKVVSYVAFVSTILWVLAIIMD